MTNLSYPTPSKKLHSRKKAGKNARQVKNKLVTLLAGHTDKKRLDREGAVVGRYFSEVPRQSELSFNFFLLSEQRMYGTALHWSVHSFH